MTTLVVLNLPFSVSARQLAEIIGAHATAVRSARISCGPDLRSRGFGFVDVLDADVERVIAALDGSLLGGRTVRVQVAREPRQSAREPGAARQPKRRAAHAEPQPRVVGRPRGRTAP